MKQSGERTRKSPALAVLPGRKAATRGPSTPRPSEIVSIGYEGRTVSEFISELRRYSVARLVDVRQLPVSRKRGFSKKSLAAHLEEAGIEYRHVRSAGNPYRLLKAQTERCLKLYDGYLMRHPGVLDDVRQEFVRGVVAVLCYERAHGDCHRSRLIHALRGAGLRSKVVCVE
jgi:uncharacterized protein (DUF488 family)